MKCPFVYQIQFDTARWSYSWNSDQNYIKTLSGGLESDEGSGASRVQGVGVHDSCENDLSVI